MPADFMDKKTAVNVGLESLAVALIVSPEPVSTVLGISLLGYTRLSGQQKETIKNHRRRDFEDYYAYKINLVNKSTINYQIRSTRQGQLPSDWPSIANLCDRPELWNSYQTSSSNKRQITSSGPQPAGLLGAPKSKSNYKFIAPKRSTNQK